jgi:hypothetical protein
MAGSDWIALVSVVFACLALGVSLYANRLQARAARSDAEKELADQIDAIQKHMAKLSDGGPSVVTMQSVAKAGNINAALQASLVRIADLIEFAKLDLTLYQNLVLGWTSVMLLDFGGAKGYLDSAVQMATESEDRSNSTTVASTRTLALMLRGSFHYQRGRQGDVAAARTDFGNAREVVRHISPQQGATATVARLIESYIREAEFELAIGNDQQAQELMAEAYGVWQRELHVRAAKVWLAGVLMSFAESQQWMPVDELLPADFVTAARSLCAVRPVGPALFDPTRLASIEVPPQSEARK